MKRGGGIKEGEKEEGFYLPCFAIQEKGKGVGEGIFL